MRSFTILPLLVASASAAPGLLVDRAVTTGCAEDNCLRAVRARAASPGTLSASADCSSFLRTTITPCPTTTTTTKVITITQSAAVAAITNIVDNTQLNTVINTQTTVVTTIVDTVTLIQPSAVQVVNSIVSAVTVTAQAPGKRQDHLEARAATTSPATCAASSSVPTSVPAYASGCSGKVRYSSACVCNGVTAVTTTLAQATATATSTSTVTFVPTVTSAVTVVNDVPVTVTSTQFVPATFETIAATVVIPSAYTVTSDLIVPTTVVVSQPGPPKCIPAYWLQIKAGAYRGRYIGGENPIERPGQASYETVQFFIRDGAVRWAIDENSGRVYSKHDNGKTWGWTTGNSQRGNQVWLMSDKSLAMSPERETLVCSIDRNAPKQAGSLGSLTCKIPSLSPNGAADLLLCGDSNVLWDTPTSNNGGDCERLELLVFNAGCA